MKYDTSLLDRKIEQLKSFIKVATNEETGKEGRQEAALLIMDTTYDIRTMAMDISREVIENA